MPISRDPLMGPQSFAIVVKAHLKLQEIQQDSQRRKAGKMQLVRQLYEAG